MHVIRQCGERDRERPKTTRNTREKKGSNGQYVFPRKILVSMKRVEEMFENSKFRRPTFLWLSNIPPDYYYRTNKCRLMTFTQNFKDNNNKYILRQTYCTWWVVLKVMGATASLKHGHLPLILPWSQTLPPPTGFLWLRSYQEYQAHKFQSHPQSVVFRRYGNLVCCGCEEFLQRSQFFYRMTEIGKRPPQLLVIGQSPNPEISYFHYFGTLLMFVADEDDDCAQLVTPGYTKRTPRILVISYA